VHGWSARLLTATIAPLRPSKRRARMFAKP
jgi:hypothetical protein